MAAGAPIERSERAIDAVAPLIGLTRSLIDRWPSLLSTLSPCARLPYYRAPCTDTAAAFVYPVSCIHAFLLASLHDIKKRSLAACSCIRLHPDVEEQACYVIDRLMLSPTLQMRACNRDALSEALSLLMHGPYQNAKPYSTSGGVARRACDMLSSVMHDNAAVKALAKREGALHALVACIGSPDAKVQRSAANALRVLAYRDEIIKNQISDSRALPAVLVMLRADDPSVQFEAAALVGNIVHSARHIKWRVVNGGGVQPIITLLVSSCNEARREAALLVGQFASEPVYRSTLAQRGAIPPLVQMIREYENVDDRPPETTRMATFALGRLAQNSNNQAGIVSCGALSPLLHLLRSHDDMLQHNAAFALYGLAENRDNAVAFVCSGVLLDALELCQQMHVHEAKECTRKMLKRLEEKMRDQLKEQVHFLLRSSLSNVVRKRAIVALSHSVPVQDLRDALKSGGGFDVLISMMYDVENAFEQRQACSAFSVLEQRLLTHSARMAYQSDIMYHHRLSVQLGRKFLLSPTMADTALVASDGSRLNAHSIALMSESEPMQRMLRDSCLQQEASFSCPSSGEADQFKHVLPLRSFNEATLRSVLEWVYTGSANFSIEEPEAVLRAAHALDLDGLKREAEQLLTNEQKLSADRLSDLYTLASDCRANGLKHECVRFLLRYAPSMQKSMGAEWLAAMFQRLQSDIRSVLCTSAPVGHECK